ncbi:MAG: fused MFS/spermidine synthase [Byssovorax sp.]
MTRSARRVPFLLFGSGLCALVYQIAWFREFRLVFGASTASVAAVLAVFVGGLGAGGLTFGKRADRHRRPLALYAQLETGIALAAAITPGLILLARALYIRLGGSIGLGATAGTVIRLLLAALVLLGPTLLMGGTLPAAARAVETEDDQGRRGVALLYGVNTLGAVTGCVLANFFLLEIFGNRLTLWLAALLNLLIAVIARALSREMPDVEIDREEAPEPEPTADAPATPDAPAAPPGFVLAAAMIVGFSFFLMELCWYRMLGPILGGTIFTFGLILAVALAGIGLGGAFHGAMRGDRPATASAFAFTCALEALAFAAAYAAGDRLATLAMALRTAGAFGFAGLVAGWTVIAGLVVFPGAFVSGVQFPLLIALLGRGRRGVGEHTARAYAANTVGAILGSIGGGFGLLPALTAPGCWRLVSALLALLGVAAVLLDPPGKAREDGPSRMRRFAPVGLALAAGLLLTAEGPTAAWRHSPIGAGRVDSAALKSPANLQDFRNETRRAIRWQAEGLESSVALDARNGLAFVLNGKADGHVRGDAATQVMSGLVGAILHPAPRKAMVIGLGTGSTAGWLGAIPSMERVDTSELEPAMLHVARACAPVNRDVLDNPKVKVFLGDAREQLLVSRERYDLIFSEPSNPYRAGIASLFTDEYYQAVAERLEPGGIFLQWVQAYEIDARTIKTIYATVAKTFPVIETWELSINDMLLVATKEPIVYDVPRLRLKVREEPYRAALSNAWGASDLEGFLAHYVARPSFARLVAEREEGHINTDDLTPIEFGFARTVGAATGVHGQPLRNLARERHEERPEIPDGLVDWQRVDEQYLDFVTGEGAHPEAFPGAPPVITQRVKALTHWYNQDFKAVIDEWPVQKNPSAPLELLIPADALAEMGDEGALPFLERLRKSRPSEADAVLARLRFRQGRVKEATDALVASFTRYRTDPWPSFHVMGRAVDFAVEIANTDREAASRLFDALGEPFAASLLDDRRNQTRVVLTRLFDLRSRCGEALAPLEPYVPYNDDFLFWRAVCYAELNDPRAKRAEQDLLDLRAQKPPAFRVGLEDPR